MFHIVTFLVHQGTIFGTITKISIYATCTKLVRMSLDGCSRDMSNFTIPFIHMAIKTHILMVTRSLPNAPYTVQVALVWVHLDTYVLYLKIMITKSYLYIALPVHSDHM